MQWLSGAGRWRDARVMLLAAARTRKVNVELARPGEWLTWQART
ncbi:hypothetical protein [Pyxidicoccus sp. MSG2]|nr:hypothetical protein [Pyxidicoccus sp. MSG2]MCY1023411.1 hypothetical protein [Pyxidicoccus sp. MSG2]